MIKLVLLCITALFLIMIAGSIKREYGMVIAICVAMILFSYGVSQVSNMVAAIQEWEKNLGIPANYLSLLIKMIGLAYLTQFGVSLCRDSGHGAMANQLAFVGKISMVLVSIPVLKALLQTIGELV